MSGYLSFPMLTILEMGDQCTLDYNVKVNPLIKSKTIVFFNKKNCSEFEGLIN